MVFEVCSRSLVLQILVAMNTMSMKFAFGSSAGEKVRRLAIVVLENDIQFEEHVDG